MKIRIVPVGGFLMLAALVLTIAGLPTSGSRSAEPKVKSEPARRPAAASRQVAGPQEKGPQGAGPQYNEKGELKRPTGFETWVFVGSNLGLEYSDDVTKPRPVEKDAPKKAKTGNFHNVYINPEAYAEYVKTGKFPEKTVLVLDIFKAEEREPRNIVSEGVFPGQPSGLAVALKDSARPDGSKTDWAYYDFGLDRPTARAFPDKACYDCHVEHADDDNVWVQFYPTLRKHRDEKARSSKSQR
jgi:hypothetical protein